MALRLQTFWRALGAAIAATAAVLVLAQPVAAAVAAPAAAACPPPLPMSSTATGPQPAERDRGFLWRATRDGRTSYLFGTLHVGKPAWRRLGPKTAAALRGTDVLALEVDPSDPELLKAMADIRPPQPLPDELQQRLTRAFERACVASESLAQLHPVLQASTLTVLEARWLGMDPTYAMEQLLSAQARALGRRVVSLESAVQQTLALVPEDEAEARTLLDQSLQQLEDSSGRRVLQKLAAAWEQGDLAVLEDFERWCECAASDADREFMRKLNDQRNPHLADGIAAQHGQGKRVFAAVGALHMTGPQSLPLLLAQRGFKVERIAFGR
jgi:uncharacterized protein YbaP (TraB family)